MSFRYIDVHTHTNFAAFDNDRDVVSKRALDAGVALINVGTQKDTSRKAVEIAEKSLLLETAVLPLGKGESGGGVYATVGLHPVHTSKSFHDTQEFGEGGKEFTSRGEVFDYDYYKKLAVHPRVVGIGECGLDYYRITEHGTRSMEHKRQEEAFRKQIELAIEVKKPLMLHLRSDPGRSAYNDSFSILKSYIVNHKSGSALRGNLHFFAGSIQEARPFLDAGFYFSFTGVITFAKEYADIIRYLPLERIMSETDAPYVSPAPYRGKRNEPLHVTEVVKAIAHIRGEDEEGARIQILKNAEHLFGIPLLV